MVGVVWRRLIRPIVLFLLIPTTTISLIVMQWVKKPFTLVARAWRGNSSSESTASHHDDWTSFRLDSSSHNHQQQATGNVSLAQEALHDNACTTSSNRAHLDGVTRKLDHLSMQRRQNSNRKQEEIKRKQEEIKRKRQTLEREMESCTVSLSVCTIPVDANGTSDTEQNLSENKKNQQNDCLMKTGKKTDKESGSSLSHHPSQKRFRGSIEKCQTWPRMRNTKNDFVCIRKPISDGNLDVSTLKTFETIRPAAAPSAYEQMLNKQREQIQNELLQMERKELAEKDSETNQTKVYYDLKDETDAETVMSAEQRFNQQKEEYRNQLQWEAELQEERKGLVFHLTLEQVCLGGSEQVERDVGVGRTPLVFTIHYEPGVHQGQRFSFNAHGQPIPIHNDRQACFIFTLHYKEHDHFQLHPDNPKDLLCPVRIDLNQALFGFQISVPRLNLDIGHSDAFISLHCPKGLRSLDQVERMDGFGLPPNGSVWIHFETNFPRQFTPGQRERLARLLP